MHFNVFKQCAFHLYHEVNVESRSSSSPADSPIRISTITAADAGALSLQQEGLHAASRKSRTSATGTSARYRKAGQSYNEEDEVESDATVEASAD